MSNQKSMMLLVGDNPFHGVSHLSQERSRARGNAINHVEHAAELVRLSLKNGADGFMFSVSETTLSILKLLRQKEESTNLRLNAIVPYAYDYVRLATQTGGIPGLAKRVVKQIVLSANVKALAMAMKGFIQTDPLAILKTYLTYEISRIKLAAGKQANLDSVFLHEIITEMALALNLDWLLKSYIDFMSALEIKPGFETRNFAFLVNKFMEWNIDFRQVLIATPFNKVGFQMTPSKVECEKALASLDEPKVIAMSIFAAGYLSPLQAIDYIQGLPNIRGVVVGVSREHHARETFALLRNGLVK